jgi:hypothetical protein
MKTDKARHSESIRLKLTSMTLLVVIYSAKPTTHRYHKQL